MKNPDGTWAVPPDWRASAEYLKICHPEKFNRKVVVSEFGDGEGVPRKVFLEFTPAGPQTKIIETTALPLPKGDRKPKRKRLKESD